MKGWQFPAGERKHLLLSWPARGTSVGKSPEVLPSALSLSPERENALRNPGAPESAPESALPVFLT